MILITGASGYIGGELMKLLASQERPIRCLTRDSSRLTPKTPPNVEIAQGDLLDLDSLRQPMQAVHTAYYLVHFLGEGGEFADYELRAARYFAKTAKEAGVQRIVYLGGLGDEKEKLSPHLKTRQEVGRILRGSGVATIEFRASIILGRDSFSFKMLQNIVRFMPVIIAYDWLRTRCQPIAIEDVLAHLVAALNPALSQTEVFDLGGPERLSYGELMQRYAGIVGLKPLVLPSPISLPLPPLGNSWLNNFAPREASTALRLMESLKHDTVAEMQRTKDVFHIEPMGLEEALRRAAGKQAAA